MKSALPVALSLSIAMTAAVATPTSPDEAHYQTDGPAAAAPVVAPVSGYPTSAPSAFPPHRQSTPTTTTRFCNSGALQFASGGAASVYPSGISVDGLSGVVTDVKVHLRGITHTDTSTLWLRLESPEGRIVGLNGSTFVVPQSPFPAVAQVDWTFTDAAAKYALYLADGNFYAWTAPTTSRPYLPRSFAAAEQPAPAPVTPLRHLLSSFEGSGPNGVWRLWASQKVKAEPQPGGEIAEGWCLDVTTAPVSNDCYFTATRSGNLDPTDLKQQGRIWRTGNPTFCTGTFGISLENSASVRYERHDFAPISAQPVCLTVSADFTGCAGKQAQIVLYDTYDPETPQTGVIGHSGYSSDSTINFSARLAGNRGFTAVVNEVTPGDGCRSYELRVEANSCLPFPGDRIFAEGFDGP
ncbi:MAG TPA: hypothetical protein VN153_04875 [Tahibacter sp.]|nr:hypothetical protein [Tahibacter sp.]